MQIGKTKTASNLLKVDYYHWDELALKFIYFYFMSIFILLTRRKATEAQIHGVGNYPDLLAEMPIYCYPLVI